MKRASLTQTVDLLNELKNEAHGITNLVRFFNERKQDSCLATIVRGIGLVEKTGRSYRWTGVVVNKNLARLVRDTTNLYKNYAE